MKHDIELKVAEKTPAGISLFDLCRLGHRPTVLHFYPPGLSSANAIVPKGCNTLAEFIIWGPLLGKTKLFLSLILRVLVKLSISNQFGLH